MKVILVAASSLNGKITKGTNHTVSDWASIEDQTFFYSLLKKHNLIVMGRKTYEVARPHIVHTKGTLRVILTNHPKKYRQDELSGMLEFSSESPKELIKRLKNYKELLLVGGSEIHTLFFKPGLIDEVYLTIEPYIFGTGKPLVSEGDFATKLTLLKVKKLNKKGTLLLRYKVTH